MSKIYDIAVVGAGPAGMSAAVYARRAAKTVILFEALSVGGITVSLGKRILRTDTAAITGISMLMLYAEACL